VFRGTASAGATCLTLEKLPVKSLKKWPKTCHLKKKLPIGKNGIQMVIFGGSATCLWHLLPR